MTKISKRIAQWLLAIVMAICVGFGIAFTLPQKTASAEEVSVTWEDSEDSEVAVEPDGEYQRLRVNTSGLHWTSYNNKSYADEYLAYTKLNGRTVKEINAEATAAGESSQIHACLQPAGSFSFYSVYIPNDFKTLLIEDVYSFSIEAGWSHVDSSTSTTHPGTGNTYTNGTAKRWVYRDTAFKQNTGAYKDFSTAAYSFNSQGDQKDGSTCFIFNTKDPTNFWTGYNSVFAMNNPVLNALYINGKSINDWNAEAQAAVNAGEATDICYGSTNTSNTSAGAPIAVRPGHANNTANGAFFQIYIANNFLPASEIYSFEWKAGFAFMFTGIRDVYYTSKDIRFDSFGPSWKEVTEFVNLDSGNMRLIDQGTSSTGINCFLIAFGAQTNIAPYVCFNDNHQKVSPLTGVSYGENLDYITINGKTIGQIKAENPNYDSSTSSHVTIARGGLYAPIFAQMSSADLGSGQENYIQVYIPHDLIDPSTVTEIGLKSRLFNLSGTTKYGLTEDVTFVKENGKWGFKPIEIETEITGVHASIQNFLTFSLSNHDYAEVAANTMLDKSRLTASGLWDYIEVNGVALTANTTSESVYNIYSQATNTYSVRLSGYASDNAEGDITSVKVKAGARFPSYAYNSTGTGTPIYYVVKEDVTFVYDAVNGWHVKSDDAQHTVTFVDGDGKVFATQEVADGEMAAAPAGTPTKTSTFDYKYTFLGWYVGETQFDFANTPIISDTTITAKFSQEDNTQEIETSILSAEWGLSNNNFLAFELGTHDYTSLANPTQISNGDTMLKATNLLDKIYFDDQSARSLIGDTNTNPHLHIFTAGRFGFRVGTAGEAFPYQKITIEAGCQFLSYAYVQGTSKTLYVTTEDIVFQTNDNGATWYNPSAKYTVTFLDGDGNVFETQKVTVGEMATAPAGTPTKTSTFDYKYTFLGWYDGETEFDFENTAIYANKTITSKFSEEDNTIEIATSILSAEWGLNSNNFLAFELGTHDYAGAQNSLPISNGATMLKATNLLDMIEFDGQSARSLIGSTNLNPHLNIFTEGKFGFRVGTTGEEFPYQKIRIKAGCQFLSNAYVEGTSKTLYVTTEDMVFVNWYGSIIEEELTPLQVLAPSRSIANPLL